MKIKVLVFTVTIVVTGILSVSCSNVSPANSTGTTSANSAADKKTYNSTGVIKAFDPGALLVIIDHEDIPGFMSAMEMSFPVANAAVLNGIAAGDKVTFALENTGGKVSVVSMTKVAGAAAAINGEQLFAANCAECHGAKGEGLKKGIPLISGHALAHSEAEYVAQIENGKKDKMPAFHDKLSGDEIAAIVKHVRTVIQSGVTPEQREHKH